MRIQQIPIHLEGTLEVILADDENPEDTFDFLFDVLPDQDIQIVTTAFNFDFTCQGMGLTEGRRVVHIKDQP